MLHGAIWNKIPLFALPVAATAILEQLFNASDIAIVGNFTGAQRTAAVAAVEPLRRYRARRERRHRARHRAGR